MGKPLVQQIQELSAELDAIRSELEELQKNTAEKIAQPYTKSGGNKDQSQQKATDISTGMGQTFAGAIVWNDAELLLPAYGTKPDDPTKGYNRHSHSRFSGGALEANTLEIIEYDVTWATDPTHHKDCQSLWKTTPEIKKVKNTDNEDIEKIGLLDLIFNADKEKWGCAAYEIDISKCFFVLRGADGEIELDENGIEKKSPLYITSKVGGVTEVDKAKTSIVWDKTGKCWRIFAVYSDAGITTP